MVVESKFEKITYALCEGNKQIFKEIFPCIAVISLVVALVCSIFLDFYVTNYLVELIHGKNDVSFVISLFIIVGQLILIMIFCRYIEIVKEKYKNYKLLPN